MTSVTQAFILGLLVLTKKERRILRTVVQCGNNHSLAARQLGLPRTSFEEQFGAAKLKLLATMEGQGTRNPVAECVQDSSMTVAECLDRALTLVG